MGNFELLNSNINQIILTMLGNQKLCKLISYGTSTPLIEPDISDTFTLLFNNIYPIPIIPKVTDEAKTVITVLLDDFQLGKSNTAFKTSRIVFNILTHIDLWSITDDAESQLRPYSILNEIDKLFNQQRIATVGKLEFGSCRWIATNEKWHGYEITYKVTEFN